MQRIACRFRAQHQCFALCQADIALPVQLHPVAFLAAVAIVGTLGGRHIAAVCQAKRLVAEAVPPSPMAGVAGFILHRLDTGADGCLG